MKKGQGIWRISLGALLAYLSLQTISETGTFKMEIFLISCKFLEEDGNWEVFGFLDTGPCVLT